MKRSWLKVAFVSALGFVAAVDVVHEILDRAFRPFTGALDTAMHYVLYASLFLYFVACLWGCFWLARRFAALRFSYDSRRVAVILLVLVAVEFAFTSFAGVRGISSQYYPLFPDFLAGAILALGTLAAGSELQDTRGGRVVVVLLVFFWSMGGLVVDSLWWTEGTERGVGPMWQLPLVGAAIAAVGYSFIFIGASLEWFLEFPGDRPQLRSSHPERVVVGPGFLDRMVFAPFRSEPRLADLVRTNSFNRISQLQDCRMGIVYR